MRNAFSKVSVRKTCGSRRWKKKNLFVVFSDNGGDDNNNGGGDDNNGDNGDNGGGDVITYIWRLSDDLTACYPAVGDFRYRSGTLIFCETHHSLQNLCFSANFLFLNNFSSISFF